jgi:hypothetical protein
MWTAGQGTACRFRVRCGIGKSLTSCFFQEVTEELGEEELQGQNLRCLVSSSMFKKLLIPLDSSLGQIRFMVHQFFRYFQSLCHIQILLYLVFQFSFYLLQELQPRVQ